MLNSKWNINLRKQTAGDFVILKCKLTARIFGIVHSSCFHILASILALGSVTGAIMAGYQCELIGRRKSIIIGQFTDQCYGVNHTTELHCTEAFPYGFIEHIYNSLLWRVIWGRVVMKNSERIILLWKP